MVPFVTHHMVMIGTLKDVLPCFTLQKRLNVETTWSITAFVRDGVLDVPPACTGS